MKKTKNSYIFSTVLTAMLIALKVVLDRLLSLNTTLSRLGLAFIVVTFAAIALGTPYAMIVAGLGDIIGALLFPTGTYFPGFTLTAALTALCTSLFLRKSASFPRIVLCVLINQIFGSILLNSLWISILYNKGFIALIPGRITQAVIMSAVQILLTCLIFGNKSTIRARILSLSVFNN